MEPKIASHMLFLDTSRAVWLRAETLYSGSNNLTRITDVYSDFFRISRGDKTVAEYYSDFVGLCEQIHIYHPPSTDLTVLAQQKNELRTTRFLDGLRPEFVPLRQQILRLGTLPSLNEIFSRVQRALRIDTAISVAGDQSAGDQSAFVAQSGSFRGARDRGRGHTIDFYYDLHPELRPTRAADFASETPAAPTSATSNTMVVSRTEYESLLRLQEKGKQPAAQLATEGSNSSCSISHSDSWLIDSGASHHMTGNNTLLSSFTSFAPTKTVTLANGTRCPISSIGTVTATSHFSLLSDLATEKKIGLGHETAGLYYLDDAITPTAFSTSADSFMWHCRLGHPSYESLQRSPVVSDVISPFHCESCQYGKHHRVSYPSRSVSCVNSPFELGHSNVWGPCRTPSMLGGKYFVIFVDDFSRMTWLYIIKDRSEVFSTFCLFYAEITNQYSCSLKCLRTDNACEYFSDRQGFQEFLSSRGIIHQSSCAHTSQQNGVAERKIRYLVDIARSILYQMHVPKPFWADAMLTACFMANRLPSSVLSNRSPFSVLHPSRDPFSLPPKVFGSVCFVQDLTPGLDKLAPRDTPYFPASSSLSVSPPPLPLPVPVPSLPPDQVPVPSLPPDQVQRPVQLYTRKCFTISVEPSCPAIFSQQAGPSLRSSSDDDAQVDDSPDASIASRTRSRTTHHPISDAVSYARLSPLYTAFISSLSSIFIPRSAREAMLDSGW
ncbi:uncharacterized protein LOC143861305 [Tasmannia lanceolata]|uniref:uncharacterized protein LOC143861305 n=1 Tax=Tasmannia lanceolata TaxID=3420 RepID=UPI0040645ABB